MNKKDILIWSMVIILIVWCLVLNLQLKKLERQCSEMWGADIKLFKQIYRTHESIARKLGALYGSDYDEWVNKNQDKGE